MLLEAYSSTWHWRINVPKSVIMGILPCVPGATSTGATTGASSSSRLPPHCCLGQRGGAGHPLGATRAAHSSCGCGQITPTGVSSTDTTTGAISTGTTTRASAQQTCFTIYGSSLEVVTEFKNLGIEFTMGHDRWSTFLSRTLLRARGASFFISRFVQSGMQLSPRIVKYLSQSLVNSICEYGVQIYGVRSSAPRLTYESILLLSIR